MTDDVLDTIEDLRTRIAVLEAQLPAPSLEPEVPASLDADSFRDSFAEALVDFAVGEYFLCNETGETRMYQRVTLSPGYTDLGLAGANLIATDSGATVSQTLNSLPFFIREGSVLSPNGDDWTGPINTALANNKRVHIPQPRGLGTAGRYGLSGNGIYIPNSHTWLSFDPSARVVPMPGVTPQYGIRAEGEEPTAWVSLTNDFLENTISFQITSLPAGCAVGAWLEFRADNLITGNPNANLNRIGMIRKVTQITGSGPYTISVNKPAIYSFLVANAAILGVATVREGLVIEAPVFNDEDFANALMRFPIYLRYVADSRIVVPRAFGTKLPYGPDSSAGDYIKMFACFGIEIEDPQMTHGAYYGLSILGPCEDIRCWGGRMTDVRHGVSIVWQSGTAWGQPVNVQIHGMYAFETSLSGFDTHDIGRDIVFSHCVSHGAGDDGFQTRNNYTKLDHCEAIGARLDGFSQTAGSVGTEAINCSARNNGRYGVNWSNNGGRWYGGEILDSGSPNNRWGVVAGGGGPGFLTAGGYIGGGTVFERNTEAIRVTAMNDLLIDGVTALADATQVKFLTTSSGAVNLGMVRMNQNRVSGYGDFLLNNFTAKTDITPVMMGNTTTETASQRSGVVTLSAGSALVNNAAYRNYNGAGSKEPLRTQVRLTRITDGGTTGALDVVAGVDGVSFTIKSSSNTDTSTVRWALV